MNESSATEWQRGLGKSLPVDGNGLFLSPPLDEDDKDSSILYVTAGDGSLHAIDPNGGGAILASILPEPIATGWTMRGTGGVALYTTGRNPFVVYAITDVPPPNDYTTPVQRYVLLWLVFPSFFRCEQLVVLGTTEARIDRWAGRRPAPGGAKESRP
jgi:hypothetical protein